MPSKRRRAKILRHPLRVRENRKLDVTMRNVNVTMQLSLFDVAVKNLKI